MAFLKQAKTEEEIKMMSPSTVKKEYNELASDYNKIVDGDYSRCPQCNTFFARSAFYSSNRNALGLYPICKKCLLSMVEQRTGKRGEVAKETKESVQKVLLMMDLPYIDDLYDSARKDVADELNEKNKQAPFTHYLTMIKSLPQYKNKTWHDSEFGISKQSEEHELSQNNELIKDGKKRFGLGYTDMEYFFLETEYQDWTCRYPCENKAQETLFKRICCVELSIEKAQKAGRDTKELDKTLQELMASLGIRPSQNNSNALTESKTFGQLIQKWETERPIPEPDEEFRDVDKIGLYIDVFFKGHLSKMMGLKNAFSSIYERFIRKYTVQKPQYEEDIDSEALFDQIFGSKVDDEE